MAEETQTVRVFFGGKEYSADDLSIGDIAELEDEFGEVVEDIDWRRKKAIIWLVWLVRRSSEPDLKLEDVAATKISNLTKEAGEEAEPEDPTEEPAPEKDSGARSPSGKSGSRGSRKSSASSRGTTKG